MRIEKEFERTTTPPIIMTKKYNNIIDNPGVGVHRVKDAEEERGSTSLPQIDKRGNLLKY